MTPRLKALWSKLWTFSMVVKTSVPIETKDRDSGAPGPSNIWHLEVTTTYGVFWGNRLWAIKETRQLFKDGIPYRATW